MSVSLFAANDTSRSFISKSIAAQFFIPSTLQKYARHLLTTTEITATELLKEDVSGSQVLIRLAK